MRPGIKGGGATYLPESGRTAQAAGARLNRGGERRLAEGSHEGPDLHTDEACEAARDTV